MENVKQFKWSKEDQINWSDSIKKYYNIEYLDNLNSIYDKKNSLFITGCSAKKSGKSKGTPSEMYWGTKNLNFYKKMDQYKLDYGICSDYLAIVFKDEEFENYDVHPSDINDQIKQELGLKIKEKVSKKKIKKLLFYNSSPLQSRPYFEMLYYSGIKSYFFTKLNLIDSFFNEEEDLI